MPRGPLFSSPHILESFHHDGSLIRNSFLGSANGFLPLRINLICLYGILIPGPEVRIIYVIIDAGY